MSYDSALDELKISTANLSDELQNAIYIAREYAKESMNDSIMPAHLLKALLHKDVGLISFIEQIDKDYYYLLEWADIQISFYPRASKQSDIYFSDPAHAALREAASYKIRFDLDRITPVCLLASITTPGVGFTYEQLKTMPLTTQEVMDGAATIAPQTTKGGTGGASPSAGKIATGSSKAIQKYCLNKNAQAAAGAIDPVIGFESEIAVIFEVLGRKTKSNLLITGESGVGKTALINGFTQCIQSEEAPDFLANATVYELDLGAMSADSNYKSETEDRFKSIIDDLQAGDNTILVIEAVDKLMDKHGSLSGASAILKQALNKGNLLLLCTASIDGYTKNIETDKEFVRKFEKITVEEPNADHCFRILKGSAKLYEKYHELTISDAVLIDAIRLAKRYLNEKALPDSGFDLIDRTMSMIRTMNSISQKDIQALQEKLEQLRIKNYKLRVGDNPGEEEAEETPPLKGAGGCLNEEDLMTQLNWLHYEIFNKVSCLLIAQLEDDVDFSKIETSAERFDYLEKVLAKLTELATEKRTAVDSSDLYAVIAKQTGIPLGKIQSKERDKLVNAEAILRKRVVGQDHAIKIILDAVFESRSGLNKKGQPMGSFFFLGPTGTGKTELAKALAEFLFQDESAMIRFDMSEFKEEHS
ncbi:MAG: AAA family ATPase, partial [Tannerella sp.]|nr:AAA family ATPase [Tannerella sp.]